MIFVIQHVLKISQVFHLFDALFVCHSEANNIDILLQDLFWTKTAHYDCRKGVDQ